MKKKSEEVVLDLLSGWQTVDGIQTKCEGCRKLITFKQKALYTKKADTAFRVKTTVLCLECGHQKKIIIGVNGVSTN